MGEVRCDWLKGVGGRDGVIVLQEPLTQQRGAFRVFGKSGQKSFEQFLRDESRERAVAVPVPQQSLRRRRNRETTSFNVNVDKNSLRGNRLKGTVH